MYRPAESLLETVSTPLANLPTPICSFCGRPESEGGGKIHDVAGHLQTFCCGVVSSPCCEGSENG
jgi:hypothetical protein